MSHGTLMKEVFELDLRMRQEYADCIQTMPGCSFSVITVSAQMAQCLMQLLLF